MVVYRINRVNFNLANLEIREIVCINVINKTYDERCHTSYHVVLLKSLNIV